MDGIIGSEGDDKDSTARVNGVWRRESIPQISNATRKLGDRSMSAQWGGLDRRQRKRKEIIECSKKELKGATEMAPFGG